MLDRLSGMAVFVEAVSSGSFTAAAKKLDMSPQMVAKHIAELERRVATRLLNRTTRKQTLTEFGCLYLETCQRVLAEVKEIEMLAQSAQVRPQGRLRVNAPVTFGRYALVPVVTQFLNRYPDVNVELTLSDRLIDPADGGYEAIVRLGPLDENLALVARPLCAYRLLVCASPAYLREHGAPEQPADLARHECLGFAPWASELSRTWRFHRNDQETTVHVKGRLRMNDWSALHSAALDGFGVLLGYEHAVAKDLASGDLIRILSEYESPFRPIHLIYAADRQMTLKLRCFVDHVMLTLGEGKEK